MAYKTKQPVYVPNLKSCGLTKTDLWAKEVGEVSIVIWEHGLVGILPTIMTATL